MSNIEWDVSPQSSDIAALVSLIMQENKDPATSLRAAPKGRIYSEVLIYSTRGYNEERELPALFLKETPEIAEDIWNLHSVNYAILQPFADFPALLFIDIEFITPRVVAHFKRLLWNMRHDVRVGGEALTVLGMANHEPRGAIVGGTVDERMGHHRLPEIGGLSYRLVMNLTDESENWQVKRLSEQTKWMLMLIPPNIHDASYRTIPAMEPLRQALRAIWQPLNEFQEHLPKRKIESLVGQYMNSFPFRSHLFADCNARTRWESIDAMETAIKEVLSTLGCAF